MAKISANTSFSSRFDAGVQPSTGRRPDPTRSAGAAPGSIRSALRISAGGHGLRDVDGGGVHDEAAAVGSYSVTRRHTTSAELAQRLLRRRQIADDERVEQSGAPEAISRRVSASSRASAA